VELASRRKRAGAPAVDPTHQTTAKKSARPTLPLGDPHRVSTDAIWRKQGSTGTW
jgi:hypothetical protein